MKTQTEKALGKHFGKAYGKMISIRRQLLKRVADINPYNGRNIKV